MKLPLSPADGGGRYPGMDALSQERHWDAATTAVVAARVGIPVNIRFFTPREEAVAACLCDHLLDQREDPRVPVVHMIDGRLAEDQTDGWHYADMPQDGDAWRATLAGLDDDAEESFGAGFADLGWEDQEAVLRAIQKKQGDWHGMQASRVWSLWTRYACTAFYSHPWAWDEIGFAGPAYPRGYKNIGIDSREPFEVKDHRPDQDPLRTGRTS